MMDEPLVLATGKALTCTVLPAGADASHARAVPDAVVVLE